MSTADGTRRLVVPHVAERADCHELARALKRQAREDRVSGVRPGPASVRLYAGRVAVACEELELNEWRVVLSSPGSPPSSEDVLRFAVAFFGNGVVALQFGPNVVSMRGRVSTRKRWWQFWR